jgi:uncharacterized protein DUF6941
MTLDWFHFCEYGFMTATGKPGVIGIHDEMIVNDFPAAIPFGFAFQVSTKPHGIVPVTLRLFGVDKSELMKLEGTQTANATGAAVLLFSLALTVLRAGDYSLTISAGGVDLPSQSIRIRKNPPPEKASGTLH